MAETMTREDIVYAAEKIHQEKLKKRLRSLCKRNHVLGRYLFLKHSPLFFDIIPFLTVEWIKEHQPKRGKKPYNEWSADMTEILLQCSERTARDYILAIELDQKLEKALFGDFDDEDLKEAIASKEDAV